MNVRIRLPRGRPIHRKPGKNRQLSSVLGALLAPLTLMAYVMAFWRLAYDLGWAGESGITGVFSHWQVWIVLAVAMNVASGALNRYGRGGELKVPRVLTLFPNRPENSSTQQRKGA